MTTDADFYRFVRQTAREFAAIGAVMGFIAGVSAAFVAVAVWS